MNSPFLSSVARHSIFVQGKRRAEGAGAKENALQVQDLVKALRATAVAGSSAPDVWMPLATTVVTRTEFREMMASLGIGILSTTLNEVETTALSLASRLLNGQQSQHPS